MASYEITPRLFYSLTAGRLMVLVIALLSAFLLEGTGVTISGEGLEKIFFLLAFAFFITICATLWFKKRGPTLPFIYAYIITDLILVTGAVYLTGGAYSHLTFLYMLVILSSCFFEHEYGPSISACVATLAYCFLISMDAQTGSPPRGLAFLFFTNMAAFWLSALLGSILAKRLLVSRQEVGRLKAIQDRILESLSSGLIITDPGGEIIFLNRVGRNILREAMAVEPGMSMPKTWPEAWAMTGEFIHAGDTRRRELEISSADRGPLNIGISCFSISSSSREECLGYGFIFQDITSLKEQEKRLQRMDRLAALGEMAAGLAHELRNPLASMSGAAQFLAKRNKSDESSRRLLQIIEREAMRLNSIAESFLLYARPERSTNQDEADPVAVIEDVLALVERKKDLPRATIETELQEKNRLSVPEGPLKQVVLNLVMNAFEAFNGNGGRIVLSLKPHQESGYTRMIIKDNGVGMDQEVMEKIFDPFYSTKPTGTGLGLAVVHRLVRSWGGDIHVFSKKDEGTQFEIILPQALSRPDDIAGPA